MSQEIARTQDSLQEIVGWSQNMAMGDMLPKQYRGKPANLMFAAEYADALGISRIHALTSIHVIDGKPSMSADLMASMTRRAGHKLRVWDDGDCAHAELIRHDDPDFTFKATFSMKDADNAQLLGKQNWQKYAESMRLARAISKVIRQGAQDVMSGSGYTPEELGVETDADGNPLPQRMQAVRQDQEPSNPPAESPQQPQDQSQRLLDHIADSQPQADTPQPRSEQDIRADYEAAVADNNLELAQHLMNESNEAGHDALTKEIYDWGTQMMQLSQQQENVTQEESPQPETVNADDIAGAVQDALDAEIVQ